MNSNFHQLYKKILQNLSVLGVSLSIYNTASAQTTVQSLRNNLDEERIQNSKLMEKVNNLISESESNSKIENIIRKSFENNESKIELLNNKVNQLIENKIIEINNNIKDLNKDLIEVIDKIDETLRSSIFDTDFINSVISYINNLNYFQSLAVSHIFAIILIFILLIDLMSLYFSDYLIEKLIIKEKYPKISKFLEIRRKFRIFYLIKDLIIIIIVLVALLILNIMLFINFTL